MSPSTMVVRFYDAYWQPYKQFYSGLQGEIGLRKTEIEEAYATMGARRRAWLKRILRLAAFAFPMVQDTVDHPWFMIKETIRMWPPQGQSKGFA